MTSDIDGSMLCNLVLNYTTEKYLDTNFSLHIVREKVPVDTSEKVSGGSLQCLPVLIESKLFLLELT